jgi:K(+)-stimulated pyrophosphate-energized sodium pump
MAGLGVIASIIGTFFVRSKEDASQGTLLFALRRGIFVAAATIAVASFFLIKYSLGMEHIGVYYSILSGLLCGIIIGLSTEYFTSARYSPTRHVADAAVTGPATVVIGGLSVGMLSTAIPVVAVAAAILAAFYLSGGATSFSAGLYGVGISAVGMLSTLGITLATDA